VSDTFRRAYGLDIAARMANAQVGHQPLDEIIAKASDIVARGTHLYPAVERHDVSTARPNLEAVVAEVEEAASNMPESEIPF
jgi:hypothetical protein